MNRRDFLRLAGVVAAGGLAALATDPVRPAAGTKMRSGGGAAPGLTLPHNHPAPHPETGRMAPAAANSGPAQDRTGMRSVQVIAGLYRLGGIRGVNAYLWRPQLDRSGPGEAILFDCGWPWSGRDLTVSLAELGYRPGDLRAIAITHGDFDHAGSLAALAAERGAEIIAHELEAPRLASGRWRTLPGTGVSLDPMILAAGPAYRVWPARPVQVTRPVREGAEIGGGWIAVHTPGHTPGHTAFFHPESKALIAGDALGSERRGHLRLPKRVYAEDWESARRSVRRLADLQPDVVCFGHGPESHGAADTLRRLAESLQIRGT